MKITLRLIISLIIVAASVAALFSFLQARAEKKRLVDELERKNIVLSESLKESVLLILKSNNPSKLTKLVDRFGNRERLLGVIIYNADSQILSQTSGLPESFKQLSSEIIQAIQEGQNKSFFKKIEQRHIYYHITPIVQDEDSSVSGALMLLHDSAYIDTRIKEIWGNNFIRLLILSFLIVITTLIVVRWSITGPIAQIADWIKELRLGENNQLTHLPRGDVLGPLASEVRQLAKSLTTARAAAEQEAWLRLSSESVWTPEKLKEHVRNKLGEKTLFLISNREPYMHVKQKRKVECIVPASGLVTALEPVMRACGGIWIAHGAGDSDREVCDSQDKLKVPPNEPAYTLKRIWLSKEEEDGHYYGFSNEGLWPLCHITHTRPTFRLEDWIQYQKVNQKFADTLLEEIKNEECPLILIQDYHFALLPLLIRKKRPDVHIAVFWHIPWPNPESFSICPWKQEILLGMLGADILGFHIQFHCNNFLDTVDNVLESKVNWENFSVQRLGHTTSVKPFPISVSSPMETSFTQGEVSPETNKARILESLSKDYGIHTETIGVGVDRLDYTKGIVERFKAVERFFAKYQQYIGKFTFIELGAPSRTHIQKYHDFIAEVEKTVDEINWKLQTKEWKPILFLKAHHSHEEILPFYKAADLCLVTSLHDGMNLVAKEFIATRGDEDGVLILSQFTGASRELKEALIVNPYDIEEVAESIRLALMMDSVERSRRMKQMRAIVQDRNIYRWAANIITAISQIESVPKESIPSEEIAHEPMA